jgi:hypothetical protein
VEPEAYEMESDEALRKKAAESNLAWNRGVAAWILGCRHSKFGSIIFSQDYDGYMPPRDPREAADSTLIQKAGKKANLTPNALEREIESLNSFLGWDVQSGSIGYD